MNDPVVEEEAGLARERRLEPAAGCGAHRRRAISSAEEDATRSRRDVAEEEHAEEPGLRRTRAPTETRPLRVIIVPKRQSA